ncbi:MAG: type II toxin-antitoxin system HicB family antitoxin [Kurthia sp.]|nr:type II toxin-antitoxin system HicB family antitoxin [Candidatus Kurthia equi]
MAVHSYYAIFEPIKEKGFEGQYWVTFPDLEGVFTSGDDFADGYEMAQEVLALMLEYFEDDNIPFNPPSHPKDIEIPSEGSLVYIQVNTEKIRR